MSSCVRRTGPHALGFQRKPGNLDCKLWLAGCRVHAGYSSFFLPPAWLGRTYDEGIAVSVSGLGRSRRCQGLPSMASGLNRHESLINEVQRTCLTS